MGKRTKKLILAEPDLEPLEWANHRWDQEYTDYSGSEALHDFADDLALEAQEKFRLTDEEHEEIQRHLRQSADEVVEMEEETSRHQQYEDARSELEEGDCVTISERDEVYWGRELLGHIGDGEDDDFTWDELWPMLENEMNRRGWYPSIYQVNDHGNITQYSVAGTVLNSWV